MANEPAAKGLLNYFSSPRSALIQRICRAASCVASIPFRSQEKIPGILGGMGERDLAILAWKTECEKPIDRLYFLMSFCEAKGGFGERLAVASSKTRSGPRFAGEADTFMFGHDACMHTDRRFARAIAARAAFTGLAADWKGQMLPVYIKMGSSHGGLLPFGNSVAYSLERNRYFKISGTPGVLKIEETEHVASPHVRELLLAQLHLEKSRRGFAAMQLAAEPAMAWL